MPTFGSLIPPDIGAALPEAYGARGPIMDPLAKMALGAARSLAVPGQVYQSKQPITTEQMVGPATDLASTMMLGSGAVPAEGSALRAGLAVPEGDRLARAAEQGFDTSKTVYHGTSKDADFSKFKAGRHGMWTTEDPAEASSYAANNDSQTMRPSTARGAKPWDLERVNQASRVIPLYAKPLQKPFIIGETGEVPDSIRTASNYKKAQSDWFDQLRANGHDGVLYGNGIRVDFDPANLRSKFAPYSPKNVGKSVIFGSGSFDPRAAGMLGALQRPQDAP